MDHRLGKWLFLAGSVLLAVALWKKTDLPLPQELVPDLLAEPEQVEVAKSPFRVTVGGIEYTIRPLYSYDLHGMVVSKHNADTWWDYLHKEWNDKLNISDLCVIWGSNASSGAYRDIEFWSEQFTCNAKSSSRETWEAFDMTAISNNHLLTADQRVAKALRGVRIGDQVHFTGYLAEYSHNHGMPFKRGTSIVRTDSGNGACETVFVEGFEVLSRGGGPWYSVQWLAVGLMILGVVAWLSLPVRLDRR